MPAAGVEARDRVVGQRDVRRTGERNQVVVVEKDQFAELEVAGERKRFLADAFHEVAVAADAIGKVVDDGLVLTVVDRSQMRLGDRHADRVADALPQRPGRCLDSRRALRLRVSGRLASELSKVLDVVERNVVAREIEQRVEQHRPVAGREHEAVSVQPVGVFGIEPQMAGPERVGHGCGTHRHARMAGVRLLDRVNGKKRIVLIRCSSAGEFGTTTPFPWWLMIMRGGGALPWRRSSASVTKDELQTQISALAQGDGDVRGREGRAVDRVIAMLDAGKLRVAEPHGDDWVTNVWVKQAILLYLRAARSSGSAIATATRSCTTISCR